MGKLYCLLGLAACLSVTAPMWGQAIGAGAPAAGLQSDEHLLLQAVNRDRAQHGLGAVSWDAALARAAEAHARLMAAQPALSHQYPGEAPLVMRAAREGAHFRVIAENVAMGPNPLALEKQWMNSPVHRSNILDPRMNVLGVGLVKRGGYYYGVEDFADGIAVLDHAQVEQKVDALLERHGVQPSGSVRDARETCAMPQGVAGGSLPKFVMRWEGSDLSHLPAVLLQKLKTGQYHTAAVGACDSSHPKQGFTTYRVAIMLY